MTGSIAEVWAWLIHVPLLGVLLLILAGLLGLVFAAVAWSDFQAGRRDSLRR